MAEAKVRKYNWTYAMEHSVNGGGKARRDAIAILDRSGNWPRFDSSVTGSKLNRVRQIILAVGWLARQHRHSVFFVQFPIPGGRAQRLIAEILFRRFRAVVLLHDIEKLQRGMDGPMQHLIARAWGLVSTGELAEALGIDLTNIRHARLEAWDYLIDPSFAAHDWAAGGPILFAGNLSPRKVPWLYRNTQPRPALLLRGIDYDAAQAPGLGDTVGVPFDPERPLFDPPVGWGLVWDGAKLDSADSDADYERINQPHKVSLYLACGLPLIVWSHSFAARLVQAQGCGITVAALADIPQALAAISVANHERMRQNAAALGEKIRNGQCLMEALAVVVTGD